MGPMVVAELCGDVVPPHPSDGVPPLSVHAVAPLVDQAAVTVPPTWTVVGVTVNEMIAGGGGVLFTSTVTEDAALAPPGPVQVKV
jgi:predicted short-subunit dehydrogenase-like oxidoreductase (DUF2520 family)